MGDSIGNSSLTLSLSIRLRNPEPLAEDSCIGHVDMLLSTLLASSADDQRMCNIII
jgi:hypothetical protein